MSESQKTAVIFGLANKRSIAGRSRRSYQRRWRLASPIKTSGSRSKRKILSADCRTPLDLCAT
jgi:hypothetical protein